MLGQVYFMLVRLKVIRQTFNDDDNIFNEFLSIYTC
jgi:hypothetical protein